MRVSLVAGFDPQQAAASGVQSYVTALGRKLVGLGQEVEVLSLGAEPFISGGIHFVPVSARARSAFEFMIAVSRYLKKQEGAADVVHAHRPDDLIPFHLQRSDLPSVLTLHGDHGFILASRRGRAPAVLYRLGERYSLLRTRSIICVSSATKSAFLVRYPRLATQLRVIPAGIDLDLFRPRDDRSVRAKIGIPEEARLVTFVGRFEPEKCPESIVDEFVALHERHGDARLLMIGEGRLESELRRRAKVSRGLITVVKPLRQEELAPILAASDLLALASKHEGLPTIALEALASGIPVVGPLVGVLPQLVEPGVNGFLVGPGVDLRSLIEKALYETSWTPSACRASVIVYGWDKIAAAILEVYRDIAS